MSGAQNRLEAADKVTLLLAFVPYLIRKGSASVKELAKRFDISEDQVRELIYLLSVSGIPGETGAYQHQDLFDINWELFEQDDIVELWHHVAVDSTPKLSAREAAALVAGIQYISRVLPQNERTVVAELLRKISLGASSLPENILVAPAVSSDLIDVLAQALQIQKSVTFSYINNVGFSSKRRVDPLRIDVVSGVTYLRGWCHERTELRTFRVDRMSELSLTNEEFHHPELDISTDLYQSHERDQIVQCVISDDALPLINAYKPEILGPDANGFTRVNIAFSSDAAIISFVSFLPGLITVTSPERAVNVVKEWVKSAISSHSA